MEKINELDGELVYCNFLIVSTCVC